MDLASKIGLQDPFYPKSAIVTAFEEIEQRICCIEENCCDEETGGGRRFSGYVSTVEGKRQVKVTEFHVSRNERIMFTSFT